MFQNSRQRQPPGSCPSGSPEAATSPVRLLVAILIVGCVGAALFHPRGARSGSIEKVAVAADRERPGPLPTKPVLEAAPAAAAEGLPLAGEPFADSSQRRDSQSAQLPVEPLPVRPSAGIGPLASDPSLPKIQPVDPGLTPAKDAPVVLNAGEKAAGLQEVLDLVNDPAETSRLPALQYLLSHPEANGKTVDSVLRAALQDHDPAFVAYAIQELAGRTDPSAAKILSEAWSAGTPETRLQIVESVASNDSEVELLQLGLKDPDELVRNRAKEILDPTP